MLEHGAVARERQIVDKIDCPLEVLRILEKDKENIRKRIYRELEERLGYPPLLKPEY